MADEQWCELLLDRSVGFEDDHEHQAFIYDGENLRDTAQLLLDRERWEELGKPEEITVLIRPGDHLNVEEN